MIYIKLKYLKKIFLFNILIIAISIICKLDIVNAAINSNLPISYIDENFPESYLPYINALKKKYPNWVFKAVHTGLDWNMALSHETYEVNEGISLVHDSYSPEWKKDGKNYYKDGTYVIASKSAVAYVMDPRNSLNEMSIFQFEALRYSAAIQTVDSVQKVLAGTPMGDSYASKYRLNGTWYDLGETYAQIIHRFSAQTGINPVHIASRIRQENSGNIINNSLINGDHGVYNFFNIGAYDTQQAGAITNGANYARNQGWTTVQLSISGGITYIYNRYVVWGQNTIYFERFDVNNPGNAQWLLGTGYMTNIFAPMNESRITYNAYVGAGMINSAFEFDIPVYKNMPAEAMGLPIPSDVYFRADNTRIYLDDPSDSGVTDEFWIRTGPDTNATILEKIFETKDGAANRTKFTRIGIGQNTLYDKIRYDDGRIGYILKNWIYEYSYVKVNSVSLNRTNLELGKDDTSTLIATIAPSNAEDKTVKWTSSNSNVARVDQTGKVTGVGNGSATITVTTNDQSKSASCTVVVSDTKVTGISLANKEYTIVENTVLTINPIITPSSAKNKNYTITSSDNKIIEVKDGSLRGVGVGSSIVTYKTEDGGYTATAKVTVTSKAEEIVFNETLRVEQYLISNLDLNNNTVNQMRSKMTTTYQVSFVNIEGKALLEDERVGTGTRIIFKSGNTIKAEYVVIVYGDVDGSGDINARDLLMLQRYLLDKVSINSHQIKAAITDKQSAKPAAADLFTIQRHILGRYEIKQ